jgi:hypothetical protein
VNRRCIGCGQLFEPSYDYHRRCWPCWRQARTPGERTDSPAAADTLVVSVETVHAAVRLCHPDRHPEQRNQEANRVTALLNGALDAHSRRRTA